MAGIWHRMSNYNFVLVCDYPFDKSESDIKLLQEFLKDIPETTILVFWYDAIEFPFKNKDGKLSAKSTKIENAFAKSFGSDGDGNYASSYSAGRYD